MDSEQGADLRLEVEALKKSIREIAHDISNPLGVMRMAVYYLETARPDEDKREHYYQVMGQTLDKIETSLKRLRSLSLPPDAGQDLMPPDSSPRP